MQQKCLLARAFLQSRQYRRRALVRGGAVSDVGCVSRLLWVLYHAAKMCARTDIFAKPSMPQARIGARRSDQRRRLRKQTAVSIIPPVQYSAKQRKRHKYALFTNFTIQPIFFRMQRFEFFSEESHHLKNKKLQIVGFGYAP